MPKGCLAWQRLVPVAWLLAASCAGTENEPAHVGLTRAPTCAACPTDGGPGTMTVADAGPPPVEAGEPAADTAAPTVDAATAAVDTRPPEADAGAGPGPPTFIALTQEQLNRIGAGNRAIDPRTLHVFLGNRAVMCNNPFKSGVPFCGSWRVMFRLPPELQRPGTWHIDDPQLGGYHSFAGPDRGGGDCSAGAGSLTFGDVTVLELSERGLVVKLSNVRTLDFEASGTYTVERCP